LAIPVSFQDETNNGFCRSLLAGDFTRAERPHSESPASRLLPRGLFRLIKNTKRSKRRQISVGSPLAGAPCKGRQPAHGRGSVIPASFQDETNKGFCRSLLAGDFTRAERPHSESPASRLLPRGLFRLIKNTNWSKRRQPAHVRGLAHESAQACRPAAVRSAIDSIYAEIIADADLRVRSPAFRRRVSRIPPEGGATNSNVHRIKLPRFNHARAKRRQDRADPTSARRAPRR